jgi:Ca2+-binding RTX toxin-like protein
MQRARTGAAVVALAAIPLVGMTAGAERADAAIALKGSFTPGIGTLVGVAFDVPTKQVYVYPDFSNAIIRYTPTGTQIPPDPPMTGTSSNDFDLDFSTKSMTINGTSVPAGTLLYVNGDQGNLLRAVNKTTGAVIAAKVLAGGGSYVGGSHHSVRGTFFATDYTTETIREVNANTGAVVASFPAQPAGSPAFSINYGDVEVNGGTGTLYVVSSDQNRIRELRPNGAFVRDIDVTPFGESTGDAYITTTAGSVFRLGGFPTGCYGKAGTIVGGNGNDTLNGTAGADVIIGNGGNDTINGLGGNDLLCGGGGNDTINGGNNNDKLRGGIGDDTLNGDAGDDALDGGTHVTADTCNGGTHVNGDTATACELLSGIP